MRWQALKTLLQTRGAIHLRTESGSHQVWQRTDGDIHFQTTIAVRSRGEDFSGAHLSKILSSLGLTQKDIAIEPKKKHLPRTSKGGKPIYVPPEGTVGRDIFDYRQENNITQEELAKLVGVSDGMIFYWERGKYQPKEKWLQKLSELHVIKSATQQFVSVGDATVDEKLGLTEGRHGEKPHIPADDKKEKTSAFSPLAIIDDRSDAEQAAEKSFAQRMLIVEEKEIDADQIFFYVQSLENEVKKLRSRIDENYIAELKRKAALYDKIAQDILADRS